MNIKKITGICIGMLVVAVLITPEQGQTETQAQCQARNMVPVCSSYDSIGSCNGYTCNTTIELSERDKITTRTQITSVSDFKIFLQRIVGWVQVFFYIIATLMIILAAYDYLSSGGSEDKVKSAKQRVIYAIVAIAIAVIAGGVVRLVQSFVG